MVLACVPVVFAGAAFTGCAGDPMPPSRSASDPANPSAPETPMAMPTPVPAMAAAPPPAAHDAHNAHDHPGRTDAGTTMVPEKP
jgi:hypothetical protein